MKLDDAADKAKLTLDAVGVPSGKALGKGELRQSDDIENHEKNVFF